MENDEKNDYSSNDSVYMLMTKLCERIASNYGAPDDLGSLKRELKSRAFAILLNKSDIIVPSDSCEPIMEMLTHYYVKNKKKKNIVDYYNIAELKEKIDWLIDRDRSKDIPYFNESLTLVVSLRDSVHNDDEKEMFEDPFSFGRIEELLRQQTNRQKEDNVTPYLHYPPHIFEMPFSLRNDPQLEKKYLSNYDFDGEIFSRIPGTNLLHVGKFMNMEDESLSILTQRNNKVSNIASDTCYEEFPSFPRLTGPREINIPQENCNKKRNRFIATRPKFPNSLLAHETTCSEGKHPDNFEDTDVNIWHLASKETKIHLSIWEEASKLPPIVEKRNLISSSVYNMSHWKRIYVNKMREINVVSETEFISHLRYLMIGVQSSSFLYDGERNIFQMNTSLCLEGVLQGCLVSLVRDFLMIGTCFYKLNQLNRSMPLVKDISRQGCVYQCMRVSLGKYLGWFLLQVEKIFGNEIDYLPGLLELSRQVKPLSHQIQTIEKIYQLWYTKTDSEYISRGPSAMAHLYNEVINITESSVAAIMYSTLKNTCSVYFKFIERFIFEGELEDSFNEFFIKETKRSIDSYNKHYWDKAFKVRHSETVPEFLDGLAKHILLCGKSLRLLKLCNPDDPLCVLLSTDYPPIKCCFTFEDIDSQQMLYDQYKTQCLYVCGQPVTFQSLLIQKEADKKAFIEMVSLKQADTMEKLIEERKRLARMVARLATAKHTQLRKDNEELAALRKKKEVADDLAIRDYMQASDRLHALKLEEDKRKVLTYYTDIGEEVKMRKLRADWKIKRLKLDDRRVELLTSEKISLNREKLEKEHNITMESDENNFIDKDIKQKDLNESNLLVSEQELKDIKLTVVEQTELGLKQITLPVDEKKDIMIISKDSLGSDSDGNADNKIIVSQNEEKNPSNAELFQEIDMKIMSSGLIQTTKDNNTLHEEIIDILDNAKIQSDEIIDNASSIAAARSVENLLSSGIEVSDITNRNTISNLKVYKSLDSDVSPSDIINSNYQPTTKSVSFSNLDINNVYKLQKTEALRNKQKVLSSEYELRTQAKNVNTQLILNNNRSEGNENRARAMASEGFRLDNIPESDINRREMPQFDTEASRQALINKQKILGDEFGIVTDHSSRIQRMKQRDNLTLDLKNCTKDIPKDWDNFKMGERSRSSYMSVDSTPDICATTPGDFPLRLDVETPSAFDVGTLGFPSANTLSPTSAKTSDIASAKHLSDKGFRFPNLIEEPQSDEETVPDTANTVVNSQTDILTDNGDTVNCYNVKSTVWNFSSDELNFDNFKPLGTERTYDQTFESMDIFNKPIEFDNDVSPYPDINHIIATIEKKPLSDFLKSISSHQEDDSVLQKLDDVDFSTMVTCLRRSIMIPLSCQMEMVNNATLKYFLINCDIYDHFESLHDYFFLMDGEFAKTISKNLFEKLNNTESPRELLNFATLHSILDKSFGSSVGGTHKYAENLSFIVNEMPLSFHHSSPDVLECLNLSYMATWPINIIISQEAVDRYGKVFQFLVKMRRIMWALEQDSESLKMTLKEEFMISREIQRSPQYHSVQIFRYKMSSLIRALHSYVLTTCLQSSWKEFEKDLIDVRTIDELYSTHVGYLKKVLFRCFLNKRSIPMMKLLNDIFAVVLRFHHFLNARCWHVAENEVHYTHPLFGNMKKLSGIFDKMAKNLYKTATRLSECGYQPHLIELATIINMNGYYTN